MRYSPCFVPHGASGSESFVFGDGVTRVTEVAEELLPIGFRWRFALFGLECALDVSFDRAKCERVFRDATDDQVSAKRYTFFESPRLAVTKRVDGSRPATIWLRVEERHGVGDALLRVAKGFEFAVFRLRQPEERSDGEPVALDHGGR